MTSSDATSDAMLAANKALVERYFNEVLDQKRIDLMPELLCEDVVLHRPGFDVMGVEAAMVRLRNTLADFVAFSSEVSGLIAEGDRVCVRIQHRTRVRPHTFRCRAGEVVVAAEQPLEWTAIVQFRIADGRIAEEWVMRDELAMLLQLGSISINARVIP